MRPLASAPPTDGINDFIESSPHLSEDSPGSIFDDACYEDALNALVLGESYAGLASLPASEGQLYDLGLSLDTTRAGTSWGMLSEGQPYLNSGVSNGGFPWDNVSIFNDNYDTSQNGYEFSPDEMALLGLQMGGTSMDSPQLHKDAGSVPTTEDGLYIGSW